MDNILGHFGRVLLLIGCWTYMIYTFAEAYVTRTAT